MAKKLSPKALGDFVRCPRCFWLDRVKNINAPRGIFPSLPGKMDMLLKKRYDLYRGDTLPPELVGQVVGNLYPNQTKLDRWRDWKTGLVRSFEGIDLSGRLDDLLWDPDTDRFSVLDYKTKGNPPDKEYTEMYYQIQADCYDLMIGMLGSGTTGKAYFVYYTPVKIQSLDGVLFKATVQSIITRPVKAMELAKAATAVLEGPMPAPSSTCEMCAYLMARPDTSPHRGKLI